MPKPKQKKEKLAYLRHVPNLVTNTFLMATPNPTPNLIIPKILYLNFFLKLTCLKPVRIF